jgi:hypothetical protein
LLWLSCTSMLARAASSGELTGDTALRLAGDTALRSRGSPGTQYSPVHRGHSIHRGVHRGHSTVWRLGRGHSTELPYLVFLGWGPGHNVFCGRTPAPVAAHAENHGNTQCWLYRSDMTLITSVQLLNHAIERPRSHVCWPKIMRWVPVPSATYSKKHALVEPHCTSRRMHSSAVLPKDNADGICCHLFRGI